MSECVCDCREVRVAGSASRTLREGESGLPERGS